MRAIYVKELAELGVVGAILTIFAAFWALDLADHAWLSEDLLAGVIMGGVVVGAVQGLLDRMRRGDLFFRHRPTSAVRQQVARTLAGLTACAVPLCALILSQESFDGLSSQMGLITPATGDPFAFGAAANLLLFPAGIAAWCVVRFALGAARKRHIVVLVALLPFLAWSTVSRTASMWMAGAALSAFAILCGALTILGLSGEAR